MATTDRKGSDMYSNLHTAFVAEAGRANAREHRFAYCRAVETRRNGAVASPRAARA